MAEMRKKQKILYAITKARWGGAQKYVYDLATSLPKDKFDVVVVVGESGQLKTQLEEFGIRVITIPEMKRDIKISREFRVFSSLLKIFKNEKPDIVHLNSSKAGGLGGLAARLAGIKKIIFTGHGWAFNEDRNLLEKFIIIFLHWLTIILCHKTIAVSETTKKQLVSEMPFVSRKIIVVHNGIKIDKEKFHLKDIARELLFQKTNLFRIDVNKWSAKTAWLGTIAELHKNKGLDVGINAIELVSQKLREKGYSLVYFIIGDGEEKQNLEKIVRDKKLDTEVFFVGYISDAVKYLKAFDLFLLPSRTEAFPYVLLEAGEAGLAIVATNVGGVPEIVDDLKSGIIVQKGNAQDIENAVMSLLSNNEMRGEFANAMYNKITNEFSLEKMIQKTLEVYSE